MRYFLKIFFKVACFWLAFFAAHRLFFLLINYTSAAQVSWSVLLASFGVGLRLDGSFTGYLLLLAVLIQLPFVVMGRRFCYRGIHLLGYLVIPIFTALLLGDANLYRYWGSHLNYDALSFLKTPQVVMASLQWWEVTLFTVLWAGLSAFSLWIYWRWIVRERSLNEPVALQGWSWGGTVFGTLLLGGLMILPIRGSLGVAPINTGVAYFSKDLFANHAAINPLWNLAYSFKRMDVTSQSYHFMPDEKAEKIFEEMMTQKHDYPQLLKSKRPNIVFILLESFSAQVIAPLGGVEATPNFNALLKEGIFFDHFYASSVRSDKGIVGVMAGYPVMPLYSIMQYPEKSQSLDFLPAHLKQAGYKDFSYLYGGDIGFKNMNSFVTLAGFDQVITIDDFPEAYRGKKWGVHDQYTFQKLIEIMKHSEAPSFNFFFTLSSHEPFVVPMEKVFDDPYYNSVYYTDRCLGDFFKEVKKEGLWDNTLFVLVADHSVVGPNNAQVTQRKRFHIPMLWTGGAVAVKDTVVSTYGGQTDIAATLLNQLDLDATNFRFSKNLVDRGVDGFAFFDYPDGFGLINKKMHQVFDNESNRFLKFVGGAGELDSLKAKAYLQMISNDHERR